jgi:RNA polymerase sigma factor (sigma-70 family)
MEAKPNIPNEIIIKVDKARQGDAAAQAFLINRYAGLVRVIVNKIVRDRSDAEELINEVFVIAFQTLGQLKDSEQFGQWLYQIARHRCLDHMRKKTPTLCSPDDLLVNGEEIPASAFNPVTKRSQRLRAGWIHLKRMALRRLRGNLRQIASPVEHWFEWKDEGLDAIHNITM